MAARNQDPSLTVTDLLLSWRGGDPAALELLIPKVYDELRRIARGKLVGERQGQTLSATDLVHEAFLRLVDVDVSWTDRVHFLAVGARVMRRILVDRCRAKARQKRGGRARHVSLDEVQPASLDPSAELLELDHGLQELAEFDDRKARAVELVYFGGLTYDELAEALGVSRATAHRDLRLGKAWLHARLGPA
ncbi:MAG: sigma-70 family RNA polymerase sigma factor [Thermoanaerobaculia bacterium]|nr:sigma-70 family RNA polymerase sigma factor [Thermoanaerobaculia bacterium]